MPEVSGRSAVEYRVAQPFRLRPDDRGGYRPPFSVALEGILEHVLALRALERIYSGIEPGLDPGRFAIRALALLGVSIDCTPVERLRIPAAGPVLAVANHPYGGLDGIALTALLAERRGDLRILANEMLCRIPELAPIVLPLDVFGGARAVHRNLKALRDARRWLEHGGIVLAFPSGTVSYLRATLGAVADPPWQRTAAWLLRQVPATRALPIHVAGTNGAAFQIAGLVHHRVRTVLLPREMLNKGGRRLRVGIGEALDPGLAARFDGDAALTRFLRVQTYLLPSASQDRSIGAGSARAVPVADPADPVAVASAVARLHDRGVLAQSSDFIVVHAHGDEEPIVLEEIGRLRETTFRTVGEGTGRGCDLDRFDAWYEHLVLWNVRERRIAGAYRIGCVDRIVSAHGRSGLYSSTLFDYGEVFLRLLGPAIEVGRSWVHADYQRSFGPLLLLWKAIGAWVVRFPHYRSLFGAVSISGSYDPRAVQLAVAYLRRHHRDVVLTGLVKPRHPFQCAEGARLLRREIAELAAPGDLDAVMSALGRAGQGLPVLVRQYLRLGGRMLGFNVDPDFGHSIDCLVAIDLRRTEPAVLARYLGRDEAACWLARHAAHRAGTPAGRRIVTFPLRTRPPRDTSAAARIGRPDAIL